MTPDFIKKGGTRAGWFCMEGYCTTVHRNSIEALKCSDRRVTWGLVRSRIREIARLAKSGLGGKWVDLQVHTRQEGDKKTVWALYSDWSGVYVTQISVMEGGEFFLKGRGRRIFSLPRDFVRKPRWPIGLKAAMGRGLDALINKLKKQIN